ncbi:MAG TPA: hypothetical protein VH298_05125, partial [Jatrophihabitans sp.]|nr:hypothetical protein [Jatrophihabitans sp.]
LAHVDLEGDLIDPANSAEVPRQAVDYDGARHPLLLANMLRLSIAYSNYMRVHNQNTATRTWVGQWPDRE